MSPTPKPLHPETREERVIRKAADIREALLESGVVWSPEPLLTFAELPPDRQSKWIRLASCYVELFG